VAIVRNKDEFIDQSISQFGNTAAYFGTGLLMDKLLDAPLKMTGQKLEALSKPWFFLGKSLSLFSLIAAVNLATPALRNYITTKRTNTTNYAEMIGEKSRTATQAHSVEVSLQKNKKRFLQTISAGAAVSSLIMGLTMLMMRRKTPLPGALKKVHQFIGLEGGKFKNFSPWSAVAFWVVPTFTGLILGARDKYEVKELGLRFAAFNLAFFVFPHTVEKVIERRVKSLKPTKLFGPSQNIAYLAKFLSSLVFCSAVPTVLNIHLTRQRVKRDAAKQNEVPFPTLPNNSPFANLISGAQARTPVQTRPTLQQ
jgi:hypothetical protein